MNEIFALNALLPEKYRINVKGKSFDQILKEIDESIILLRRIKP